MAEDGLRRIWSVDEKRLISARTRVTGVSVSGHAFNFEGRGFRQASSLRHKVDLVHVGVEQTTSAIGQVFGIRAFLITVVVRVIVRRVIVGQSSIGRPPTGDHGSFS